MTDKNNRGVLKHDNTIVVYKDGSPSLISLSSPLQSAAALLFPLTGIKYSGVLATYVATLHTSPAHHLATHVHTAQPPPLGNVIWVETSHPTVLTDYEPQRRNGRKQEEDSF